MHTAIIINVLN